MVKYKVREQRNRKGDWVEMVVNTKAKVDTLQFLEDEFWEGGNLNPFTTKQFLNEKFPLLHLEDKKEVAKNVMRLRGLVKNGWLTRPDKLGRYGAGKKFINYLKNYRTFRNGPLIKEKEPESEIKERVVEKEIGKINRREYLGWKRE